MLRNYEDKETVGDFYTVDKNAFNYREYKGTALSGSGGDPWWVVNNALRKHVKQCIEDLL